MGETALLIELDDADQVRALARECARRRTAGELVASDVVPGERTVLIDGVDATALAAELPRWSLPPVDPSSGALVEVPVRFDGPDLAHVAAHWDVSPEAVPRIVLAAELSVAFCGFAPGFAYLAGLGREVPRRAEPRTSVPAGAVALAGAYAGIYPSASPGGWQIVGTAVGVTLWDPARDPAALLAPGVRVRFVEER